MGENLGSRAVKDLSAIAVKAQKLMPPQLGGPG
jgi:hypothetical protein